MANENQKPDAVTELANIKPFTGAPVPAGQAMPSVGTMAVQAKTQYTTAVSVQQPRSLDVVLGNLRTEARLAGASFFYRWPTKNKDGSTSYVQGASIDLAMSMAREYGNCAVEVGYEEKPDHFLFEARFVDLERGFTVTRYFKQRKSQNLGGRMNAGRAEDLVLQIGQSKAQRNAVLKAMPLWMQNELIEIARKSAVSGIEPENLVSARAGMLEFYGGYGVTPKMIEKYFGVTIEQITAQQIADLRGIATGVQEGRVDVREVFEFEPHGEPEPAPTGKEAVTKPTAKKEPPPKMKPQGDDPRKTLRELNDKYIEVVMALNYGPKWEQIIFGWAEAQINQHGLEPVMVYERALANFDEHCQQAAKIARVEWPPTIGGDGVVPEPKPVRVETKGGDDMKPVQAQDPLTDEAAWRKTWISMRGGFQQYVEQNTELFARCSADLHNEAQAKWNRMASTKGKPWPVSRETASEPENSTQAPAEGDSRGPGPGTASAGAEPEPDGIFDSPEWAEASELYGQYPAAYGKVTKEMDKVIAKMSLDDLRELINRVRQEVGLDPKF